MSVTPTRRRFGVVFPLSGWRWVGGLALSLALTTCTESPSGPGGTRRAQLALQPVFAQGIDLAAFGISIDSLRVVVVRPAADTLADATYPFPADSPSINLPVSVNLIQPVETLTVYLEFRGGGIALFSGSQSVEVQAGAAGNPPATVAVNYSGPGAGVDSIDVTPDDSTISFNDSLRFRVAAFQGGVPVAQFYASWTTSDTLAARVNAVGLVRAPALRRKLFVIARTPSGASDSTPVTFQPVATALSVVSGGGQSGPPGSLLGQPLRVRVVASDGLGVKDVPLTFAAVTGGGSVTTAAVVSDTGGYAETTVTLGPTPGSGSFSASVAGLTPVFFPVSVVAGVATQLVFTVQPGAAVAGGAIPAVVVQARDAGGLPATGFVGSITIALGANPGGDVLGGTLTLAATNGQATFSNLTLTKAAAGYTLVASSGALTPDTSAAFGVAAAAAANVALVSGNAQSGFVGVALGSPIVVRVADIFANPVAGFTVTFATGAGGSFTSASVPTDAAGLATSSWTLGPGLGTQAATATATGLTGSPVPLSAVAAPIGTTKTWNGSVSGNWSVAGNWTPTGVPGGTDNVFVPTGTPNGATLSTNVTTGGVVLQNGAGLVLGGATLTTTGDVDAGTAPGITAGFLALNGAGKGVQGSLPSVVVNGNTVATGRVTVNGSLTIAADFAVGGRTVVVSAGLTAQPGRLIMISANDTVDVSGTATFQSDNGTGGSLSAGTLILRNGFQQNGAGTGQTATFAASGTHKTVFAGTVGQTINFQYPGASYFQDVTFANGVLVTFASDALINGAAVVSAGTVVGAVNLTFGGSASLADASGGRWQVANTGVSGNVTLPDSLQSNVFAAGGLLTKRFTTTGTVQVTGDLDVNGKKLRTYGALTVQPGRLVMDGTADTVDVAGAATFQSDNSTGGTLTAGVVVLRGSFQQNGAGTGQTATYAASGTHKTVFAGTATQTITFQYPGSSNFQDVEFANGAGVNYSTNAVINGAAVVSAGAVTGSVSVTFGGSASLADAVGGRWQVVNTSVSGNVTLPDSIASNVFAGSGLLTKRFTTTGNVQVTGDLDINGTKLRTYGALTVQPGRLVMDAAADTMDVSGTATFQSDNSTAGTLTAGVLLLRGDFQQNGAGTGQTATFAPSGTHKTVFAGTAGQAITFQYPGSSNFQDVEFANGAGVNFSTNALINGAAVVSAGAVTGAVNVTLGGSASLADAVGGRWQVANTSVSGNVSLPDSIASNVFAGSGLLTKRFTTTGNVQVTGDLDVNGQVLRTYGALTAQPGRVVMDGSSDTVDVGGAATFQSDNSTAGTLTDGVLLLRGSFQQNGAGTGQTATFAPSGIHKTVFAGTAPQAIGFQYPGPSGFANLEFAGTGVVTLSSGTPVAGQLSSPAGPSTVLGSGQLLAVVGLDVDGLTLDNVTLSSTNGTLTRFDNVTFQNMDPTATQLAISHPGAAAPFQFTNVQFLTTPTTGKLIGATDNTADANVLTINMVGSQPADGSALTLVAGGAVVNWAAVSFTAGPATVAAGAFFSPVVQVTVRNALGGVDLTYNDTITVALGANPGSATLSGTVQQVAVAGVAAFPDLTLDKIGAGYTLTANARGIGSVSSASFAVTPGPISAATSLVTVTSPSLGVGQLDTVILHGRDAFDNVVTTGGATVVFTQSGTGTGTFGTVVDSANGVYTNTFTALTLGPVTIGATINGSPVTTTLPTLNVITISTTHSADITADETWTLAGSPHIVTGYLRVRNGATLTIDPNAVVKFDAGAGLQVGDTTLGEAGGLALEGSGGEITMTANTATPVVGFWRGIEVQRALAVSPWRRTLIEWGGGPRSNPFNEACILVVNGSGAPFEMDSLRIRQCVHAGIHHFGGQIHVRRSTIDSVTGSGIHADFSAQLELDSTVIRGSGQEGLFLGTPLVQLGPSSANQFRGNLVTGVHLHAAQLPGLLAQDTLVGNGSDAIEVEGGQPDPAAASLTLFSQPHPSGADYHVLATGGLLDVGRPGGQELVIDSGVVVRFDPGTGLVIGDSAGSRSGTLRSLGTGPGDAPLLRGSAVPASWIGVEIGRLAAADTIRNLRIENAGDSLPGRTVHRAGMWVRSPVVVPLVLDSVVFFGNGSSGAASNAAGFAMTAPAGGVDVRNSTFWSTLGYGLVVPDNGFRITGNLFNLNTIGIAAFTQGGSQITAVDSIAGNTLINNQYAVSLTAAALRAFYETGLGVGANVTDTLRLEGSFLTADAQLPHVPGYVWHAAGSITVDSNATFTIAPGDTVTFDTLVTLQGPSIPAFVRGFPVGPSAIFIGGLQGGALAAPGTVTEPILLTGIPGHGWGGITWAKPQGALDVTNNVFTYVTVERAGYFAPCFGDCLPNAFSALRITDSTDVNLTFDHVIVRGSGAFGLDFEREGTGTVTVSNSEFYNNNGGFQALSGRGNQLTITGSDIYAYRGTAVAGTYQGLDSVNANGNWWGDVAGPNPGFSGDSLGRASFGQTAVRAAAFAGAPFFPVGSASRLIAARDTFLTADTVLSIIGQSDSIRVRVLDADGRGVPGTLVSWVTTSGTVSPGGTSDIGGRVGTQWQTSSVAGLQSTTASGVGTPVVFPLDLLPGNTIPTTVDWEILPALTAADSVRPNAAPGVDTVFYSSSNHPSVFLTHARDTYGNVTQPTSLIFDQGPCSGFACRFPAADSVKGDTVFFRPPEIGDYVITGLYEFGAGGSDQIVLRVTPVAFGVRIDRDTVIPGIQDTGSVVFNAQCRVGVAANIYCSRAFRAYVVDSGGAPFGNNAARFAWLSPGGDTTITIDSTRSAPIEDLAFTSAHADGPTYLVAFDTSASNYGRDSLPIAVDQRPGNILLSPASDTLVVGDSTVFIAAVVDNGGDTMPALVVHWRVDPNNPGLTILDTSVANQVKVRLDSAPFGDARLDVVTCCSTAQPPFDTVFVNASVFNPVQIAVNVGTSPGDVSVNPVTHRAYVALFTDTVAVVDLDGDTLLARIPVGGPTYWTAVNATTNRVYVGGNGFGTGYMIDGASLAVLDSFSVGSATFVAQMAVDEPRNRLYVPMVLCIGSPFCVNVDFLGVFDGTTLALLDTVPVLRQALGTAYDPVRDRIYVALSAGLADTVKVIDATTLQVVDSIAVGAGVTAVAVNPVTGKVYVTSASDHSVTVIDGTTHAVLATLSLGFSSPVDVAVDTVANLVYLSVSDNSFQFVIDGATDQVTSSILLDGYTDGVAAMPNRGPVVFTQFQQNILKILHF